jgi:hypothetical protein
MFRVGWRLSFTCPCSKLGLTHRRDLIRTFHATDQWHEVNLICAQGYVTTCIANITKEKFSVGMSQFPIGPSIEIRSQWQSGLRYELFSPAQTPGSWIRISLEAWMFVRVYSVFVLLCVGSGRTMGRSHVQGVLPTMYRNKRLNYQGPTMGCKATDNEK